ncbi:MAG: 30S ribosome-binding factor RbfA [Alphaproteobacteria bacterium]|nr:30S ribosome-binding factor RbfA [Alphaproteobacteria bacterium]
MAKRNPAHEPSQRQLRVGEEIRRVLAETLERGELHDSTVEGFRVIISEVRISPDFSIAKVFVAPLGGGDVKEIISALSSHKGQLRKALGQKVRLRITPDLTFLADKSFEEAHHINQLLHLPEVQRDLNSDGEEDE